MKNREVDFHRAPEPTTVPLKKVKLLSRKKSTKDFNYMKRIKMLKEEELYDYYDIKYEELYSYTCLNNIDISEHNAERLSWRLNKLQCSP